MHKNMSRGIHEFNYDFVHFVSCFPVPTCDAFTNFQQISSSTSQSPKEPRLDNWMPSDPAKAQSAVTEMAGTRQLARIVASVPNGTFKKTLLADGRLSAVYQVERHSACLHFSQPDLIEGINKVRDDDWSASWPTTWWLFTGY